MPAYQHVEDRWEDEVAEALDPLGRLVYRSNLLGQNWRITNTGGGNTSSKLVEEDPLTGEETEVLWVKGSGGDLRTAERENFASLYQDRLLQLQEVYAAFEERDPKSLAEDKMADMLRHCTYGLNPRAPSIDTPLHSFIPYKHVDHTHPVAVIALATAEDGPELTKKVYGDEVVWLDWQRPGFELGLSLQELCREYPDARGAVLGGHGLINWADTDRTCYHLSLDLIDKAAGFLAPHDRGQDAFGGARYASLPPEERARMLAELLPWLRGRLSREKRVVATVQTNDAMLDFIGSRKAPRLAELGTSCPDHFIRTRIKPLYVGWDPQEEDLEDLKEELAEGLASYREDYAAYYETHKRPDSPPMRGTNPTVVLIPGLGMVAWGKSKSESRVTAEFYNAAVEVMRGAEAMSSYTALPRREAFDIEYWRLEEAKIRRRPPEKELARRVAVVVGGGSGIGAAVARRLIDENATVAVLDLDAGAAEKTATDLLDEIGMGIGVAGSSISGCGAVIGVPCDVTDRASVREALDQVVLAYGGLDHVVVTAGLYVPPDGEGRISDEDWTQTFAVNAIGPHLVADEAGRRWSVQGLTGSMVITTSVNAVVPKAGSMAYDASKAAANHLVRELALEMAPLVRVNGLAPAAVVEGSAMFPRERVIASLEKYGLPHDENASTKALRGRLADFYAGRTLLQRPVTPEDQAEALYLLVGERLGQTTGQVLTIDGGLKEAFLR